MLAGEYAAFWGVLPGDRALVVAQDHTTGDHVAFPPDYHGAGALDVHTANTITMTRRVWRPELTITSVVVQHADLSEVTGLQVRLHDHARATDRVQMAYCPAGSDCDAPVDVSLGADGIFDHTFSFPVDGNSEPPAAHGYIYVRAPETGEETVAWYQRAGGIGPATIDGHAPLLDGSVNVDQAEAAVRSDVQPQQAGAPDTHVLYSPAGHGASTGTALPSGVLGIIGTPWYVQPVIANREGTGWGPNDPPLRVRLSYNQDLLDRLGIDEEQLVVLRLNREGRWEPVASQAQIDIPVQRSHDLDWIVVTAQQFNGEGEVYALAYTPFRMRVPVVQRP
jgi:hypothetical protein